ncbi:type IV pilus biogenesis protein PilM [Enterobacter hormaechei]|nr:type IV pilus biogenesis protein PilM [Enterobacter hormaechei]ELD3190759.1 type IV pilus biogenesis protein PilM [Enterobacter hormaechei]
MFMYWLLVIFAGFLLSGPSPDLRAVHEAGQLQDQTQNLHATQMVRYMNRINDWRYMNPSADNVSVSDAQLTGWKSVTGLSNVIASGRTYVWRSGEPGLMAALLTQTRQSALAGRVVSRRLLDSTGADMQFTVPAVIPDGSVVWVN